jgi:hypothetical protein
MGTSNENLTWELNFGQNHMGINPRCYWELFGEQLEEFFGNLMGTYGNKEKTK